MTLPSKRMPSLPGALERMREEFNRTLLDFWEGKGGLQSIFEGGDWLPSVDVSESDTAVEVEVDLPGIKPEDVDVSVADNLLTIRGERTEEAEDKKRHRVERRYGSFYRSIPLPVGANPDNIKATTENGVLTITIPKKPEATPRKIQVKSK